MLLRAAVIYVLAVAILLLGGAVMVQRIQIATVKSERVTAENAATEMRKQLDTLHTQIKTRIPKTWKSLEIKGVGSNGATFYVK